MQCVMIEPGPRLRAPARADSAMSSAMRATVERTHLRSRSCAVATARRRIKARRPPVLVRS
jgi:hypothetical protein